MKKYLIILISVFAFDAHAQGQKIYINQYNPNQYQVLDSATDAIVDTIPVDAPNYDAHLASDESKIVAWQEIGSFTTASIDVSSHALTIMENLIFETDASLDILPDNSKAYVSTETSARSFDLPTSAVVTMLPGLEDRVIRISPNGAKAYFLSTTDIKVVNTVTDTVEATITVSGNPYYKDGLLFLADSSKAYYINDTGLTVINVATSNIIITIPLVNYFGKLIMINNSKIYVCEGSGIIHVINTNTNTITATISVPGFVLAQPLADRSKIYLANHFTHEINIVNTSNNTLTSATISLPSDFYPIRHGVSLADSSKIYISGCINGCVPDTSSVKVIDVATNSIVSSIDMPGYVGGLLVNVDYTPTPPDVITSNEVLEPLKPERPVGRPGTVPVEMIK